MFHESFTSFFIRFRVQVSKGGVTVKKPKDEKNRQEKQILIVK
jgi:hypothetical protein